MLRQFGQVLGIAVLGALIDARAAARGFEGFITGLHAAMWGSRMALLGTAVLAAVLLRLGAARGITSPESPR